MNKTEDIKWLLFCRTIAAIVLFLYLTVSPVLAQQDIVMRGVVVLQNSKTLTGQVTYIPDVNISSVKTTPTRSDARGQFKLVFANMNFGAKTNIAARKSGMMVLNKEVLQEAAIVGRTDTLKVVMCDENQFEVNKQNFYNISTDNLQRELARRVNKLQRANAVEKRQLMDSLQTEMNVKLTSSEDAIAQLENRSKSLEAQLEKISHDFAAVNLDDASETYRLAYTAFTEGYVQKSLDILNAIDLKKRLKENVVQISQRDTQIGKMQRQNDTSRTQISQDIQSCLLMANNHKILFQHREAQDWYETAIEYDSLNLSLLNEYTSYLFEFAEYSKATRYNDFAIEHARALRRSADSSLYTEGYAEALYYRALIWSRTGLEPQIVKESSFEALPLFEQMAQTDTLKRLMRGRLMSELAQAYSLDDTEESDSLSIVWYNNAILVFGQSVSIRLQNNQMLYKSMAYSGLSIVYKYKQDFNASKIFCDSTISIRKELYRRDSFTYAPYLALAYTNLAATLNDSSIYDTAIQAIGQSLRYSNTALLTNPLLSQKEMIRAKLEWVKSLHRKRQFDASEQMLDSVGSLIKSASQLYSDSVWVLRFFTDFTANKRILVSEYLKQGYLSKALNKSQMAYEFPPIANADRTILTTYAIALVFNNQYDKALQLLETLDGDKPKNVKLALSYFERRNIIHPNFTRLKNHFGIID